MTPSRIVLAAVAAMTLSACVGTPAAYEARAVKAEDHHSGYLDRATLRTLAGQVPPPPLPHSDEARADAAASNRYRTLENTDRWLLATSHAELRSPYALQHFDCALGLRFEPANNPAPASARLFQRLFEDAEGATAIAKLKAYRPRPVAADPSRAACQTLTPAGRASPSYPSGSGAVAAAYGEALAAAVPEKADDVRAMARHMAESRAVCGMHYPRDIAAGQALGLAVFEAVKDTPAFKADIIAARAEILALQAQGLASPACAAERAALRQTP